MYLSPDDFLFRLLQVVPWAVLPQDKALEAEIFRSASVKRCAECGAAFVPRSNRAKYCEACAKRVHRRLKNASDRKRRWNTDK